MKHFVLRQVAICLLFAGIGWGQVATARLEGVVTDASGSVVPAASATARNTRTGISMKTTASDTGFYIFPSLQPGLYSLTIEAAGFRTSVISAIEMNVSGTVAQNVKLEVGSVTESVTIESNAVRVQTAEAQISRAVTLKDIDTLPQLGRSPIILSVFQPGVAANPSNLTFARVNGTREGSNNTTLDGIDVNDAVVPRLGLSMTANNTDSVEEFRVVLNGGKAEYGRNAGAQVELITRSGTNDFHGNLFDYHRNTVLNANDWFNNSSRVLRPKFIQNFFGGSAGGRLLRDKTFFFFNYQGRRTAQELVRNRTVLTPEAKQGLFRWNAPGGGMQTFDITRNDPRSLGIDAEVRKNIALLPNPNNFDVGDGLNSAGFRFNNSNNSFENQWTMKIDHNLWDGHRVFYRHSWQNNDFIDSLNNADARYPGQPHGTQGGNRWGYSIGSDWQVRPTMVNELRFGYQSASVDFRRPARPKGPAQISNTWTDPILPNFAQGRNSPVYDFTDNFSMMHGKHTVKAGMTFRRTLQYGYNDAGIYPDVTFARTNGNIPPATIGPAGAAISSADRQRFENLYNDLLGRMSQVSITYYSDLEKFQPAGAPRVRNTTFKEYGFFLQDDWKVTPRLTVNAGLRYELLLSPVEISGLQGSIDRPELVNTVSQISNFTVRRTPQWYNNDWNNFAPRFGFAWDLLGNSRIAIRGGYGVFYDRVIGAVSNAVDGATPGFSQNSLTFPNSAAGADVRLAAGVPTPAQPGRPVLQQPNDRQTSIYAFDPNLRTGYFHHFNLNIQIEVMRNTVMDIGYVGTRGIKLFTWLDMNQPRIYGDFLNSFREIQAFRATGATVPASNTLVRLFGSPAAAVTSIGASTFDQGLVGAAANTVDRSNYTRYRAAGVSDFYLRNFPQYNLLRHGDNNGHSYYNSLQASIRRQTGALKFQFNYTFSRSIDNTSVDGNGFTAPIDNYNFWLNRGLSDFDIPHVLNGSVIYTLPVGRGKSFGSGMPGWADSMIGGWDIGLLTLWQAGRTMTITSGRTTGPSTSNTWANYSGDRTIGTVDKRGNGVYYFSPDQIARFSFPGAGEVGTSGRNAFRGPSYINFDASIVKRFRIWEQHSVTFRAEMYNMLNHPTFGSPGLSLVTPASFGRISAVSGAARIMQMALRYDF
jgi:hypothetical protein